MVRMVQEHEKLAGAVSRGIRQLLILHQWPARPKPDLLLRAICSALLKPLLSHNLFVLCVAAALTPAARNAEVAAHERARPLSAPKAFSSKVHKRRDTALKSRGARP